MGPKIAMDDDGIPEFSSPRKTGKAAFLTPDGNESCETAYTVWGDLNCPVTPLICLHGGPGMPSQYMKPLSLLHDTFGVPVVLYDQLGCGNSTHLPKKKGDESFWTFELFISELQNLLRHLDIQKYDVFGHSWGGMLASEYALNQPPGLRKIIICSSPASLATRCNISRQQRAQLPPDMVEIFERCEKQNDTESGDYRRAMLFFYMRHMIRLDPLPLDYLTAAASGQKDKTVYSTLYGGTIFRLTGSMKSFDITNRLKLITTDTAPGGVLLLNGKYDSVQDIAMQPFVDNIRAQVKWVRLINSSHMPFWEEPEAFITAVGEFLTQ